jgi:hypothetical protein
MKKTILLTLTLIISYASIGQNLSTVGGKLIVKGSIDNGDKLRFFDLGDKTNEVLRLNSLGDTLEIKSPIVKFIKIDGKVYEIKRTTELKEVDNIIHHFNGWGKATPYIHTDTVTWITPKIKKQ